MISENFPSSIAVVGLGYVGLPLAVAFSRYLPTLGFDVNRRRVEELCRGYDRHGEVPSEVLSSPNLSFASDLSTLKGADFIVIAVPTPIDRTKRPDLSCLIEASRLVGQALKSHSSRLTPHSSLPIVVYESTVYPGCTEEVCIPILEQESGLKAGVDFKVGYSPERINPGDREHTLEKVVKVVAGQDAETTEIMARVYGLVVKAGIYKAPDIRTAEAAKVIENIQRDINIALMNELSMLFHRMGLNTWEVFKAARTKWNFLPFEPGLVGGHCIPVDPYYLTHKAQEIGYHPEIILAGRRINDRMGYYVAQETVRLLIRAGRQVQGTCVLVLGISFKENVKDLRNSRVLDLIRELEGYGCQVFAYDPIVGTEELKGLNLQVVEDSFKSPDHGYDAVILAVPHRAFREQGWNTYLSLFNNKPGVFVDVKGIFAEEAKVHSNPDEVIYWSL